MFYHLALLLPCSVCLFYAAHLTFGRKENTKSQNILALCLLLTSVSLIIFTNHLVGVTNYETYYLLDIVDCFVSPIVFPMMYMYFKSLSNEKAFNWKDYLWFAPAILIGCGTLLLYMIMGEKNVVEYTLHQMTQRPPLPQHTTLIYQLHHFISIKLYTWIIIAQTILISIYAVYNILRYHSRLMDFYSNLNDKSIDIDYKLLVCFLLSGIFATTFALTGRTFWSENLGITMLFCIAWTAVYFGLGYNGSKRKYSVENLENDLRQANIEEQLYANDPSQAEIKQEEEPDEKWIRFTKNEKYQTLVASLEKLIKEDIIFLKSDLRLDEVARLMYTNRVYVSRVIKEEYKCSFSDYINRKRVDFAMNLMLSNPNLKQEDLAIQSGFTNAPSFSRTFKQITGVPPREWCKTNVPIY